VSLRGNLIPNCPFFWGNSIQCWVLLSDGAFQLVLWKSNEVCGFIFGEDDGAIFLFLHWLLFHIAIVVYGGQ
jgi:hypothetical protein